MVFSGFQIVAILNSLYRGKRRVKEIVNVISKATRGRIKIKQGSIYTQLDRLHGMGFVRRVTKKTKTKNGKQSLITHYSLSSKGRQVLMDLDKIRSWHPE